MRGTHTHNVPVPPPVATNPLGSAPAWGGSEEGGDSSILPLLCPPHTFRGAFRASRGWHCPLSPAGGPRATPVASHSAQYRVELAPVLGSLPVPWLVAPSLLCPHCPLDAKCHPPSSRPPSGFRAQLGLTQAPVGPLEVGAALGGGSVLGSHGGRGPTTGGRCCLVSPGAPRGLTLPRLWWCRRASKGKALSPGLPSTGLWVPSPCGSGCHLAGL